MDKQPPIRPKRTPKNIAAMRWHPGIHASIGGRVVVCVLVLLSVCPDPALSKPVENYQWIEVRSQHFLIRSSLSKNQTLRAARFLELQRAAIPPGVLPDGWAEQVPDVIYLFKRRKHLREIGYSGKLGESFFYIHRNGERFILVHDPSFVEYALVSIYARFLMQDQLPPWQMLWLKDGLASIFGTARISKGKFRFGHYNYWRFVGSECRVMGLISGEDRRGLSNDSRRDMRQCSELLIRYLTKTSQEMQNFGEKLQRYLELNARGQIASASFEMAFDVAIDDLTRKLSHFERVECCREIVFPLEELLPHFDPNVAQLSQAQVALGLAKVSVSLGDKHKAIELFDIALADESTQEEAEVGLREIRP